MKIQQLSVFLENKPGHLSAVLKHLAEAAINIHTLTIAESVDFGVVRMIVDKPEEAVGALKKQLITCSLNDVLGIAVEDKPGALYKLLDAFTARGLNVEYMYAFPGKQYGEKAVMIFRFEQADEASKALADEGYDVVRKIDLLGDETQ